MKQKTATTNGVIGHRRCKKCDDLMDVRVIAGKETLSKLPCTASCPSCGNWFDCREPEEYVNKLNGLITQPSKGK